MTVVEEQEKELMESKLSYQPEKGRFITESPWIREPSELPEEESRNYAAAVLKSTEKRLLRNNEYGVLYQRQVNEGELQEE